MRLAFAMLADSADTTTDGKISIGGGGIDVVRGPSFPSVHPMLVLVVQLISEPSDEGKGDQKLVLDGTLPSGIPWFHAEPRAVPWREPDALGRPAKHTFIAKLAMLALPMEGKYTLRLLLDGEEIASFPLWAELATPANQEKSERGGEG